MIHRKADEWINSHFRNTKKALLLTGARQVVKTYAVRLAAERLGWHLVEKNFLLQPETINIVRGAGDIKKLLLVMLLMAVTSISAFAEILTGNCGDGVTYSYDSDTGVITIEGNGKMDNYENRYNNVVNGYVTTAPWGKYFDKISRVVIGNGITYIGEYAFCGCPSLTNIDLSETVTTIGMGAFEDCNSVTSLTIPKSLESFGFVAFLCHSLTSIEVDEENPYFDSRENCNAIVRKSDDRLMLGCANTVIPSSVRSISDRAFMHCEGLTSLTIPENVSEIDEYAFSGCM